ncbi:hypothetical protein RRG08_028633 [Elysia crispata]|uniref:Uncharacterized protein n=1 Tax=Elysia crispata TaxID=231223 RepID=A0AAE0ZTS8_9GAST|nr:hypothetical protein RRG08_028633 [Elysia crispata]
MGEERRDPSLLWTRAALLTYSGQRYLSCVVLDAQERSKWYAMEYYVDIPKKLAAGSCNNWAENMRCSTLFCPPMEDAASTNQPSVLGRQEDKLRKQQHGVAAFVLKKLPIVSESRRFWEIVTAWTVSSANCDSPTDVLLQPSTEWQRLF